MSAGACQRSRETSTDDCFIETGIATVDCVERGPIITNGKNEEKTKKTKRKEKKEKNGKKREKKTEQAL